jgi:hypothetical protein
MIKLKDMIPKKYFYHITPRKNIPNMKIHGIVPKPDNPAPFCDKVVCLFDNRTSIETAFTSWLLGKFNKNEPMVLLTIDPTGLDIHSSEIAYEFRVFKPIPWKNVVKVENI